MAQRSGKMHGGQNDANQTQTLGVCLKYYAVVSHKETKRKGKHGGGTRFWHKQVEKTTARGITEDSHDWRMNS